MHRFTSLIACALLLALACPALAQNAPAQNWSRVSDELRGLKGQVIRKVNTVDAAVAQDRKAMRRMVKQLKADSTAMRAKAKRLENKLRTLREQEARLEAQLESRQATMRKIESTVRDNARMLLDMRKVQPVFASVPKLAGHLERIATPGRFPEMADISLLMDALLRAAEENGKAVRRQETVYTRGGDTTEASVLRLGSLQALYEGGGETGFLLMGGTGDYPMGAPYLPDEEEAAHIRAALAAGGTMPLDFSGGRLLADPPARRTVFTILEEGGFFLWPILAIGFVGILIVIERCLVLSRVKVSGQRIKRCEGCTRGPADRVLKRMHCTQEADPDLMEKRLEEALLDELPPLERFLQTLKVLATVSPLLGLLGTVSGIIQTFRIITLHGNGDPKLLSAGISEALLTTELGLLVAIPLLLCHHFLSRRVNTIVLDMEMAGTALIVQRCEGGQPPCSIP